MIVELPWPPSNNVYYRHIRMGKGVRSLISEKGRVYKNSLRAKTQGMPSYGRNRVAVFVTLHPPDKRKRDLDNFLKALLDGLKADQETGYAGLFDDDEQVDKLSIERGEIVKGGVMVVEIHLLGGNETNFATKPDILDTGLF